MKHGFHILIEKKKCPPCYEKSKKAKVTTSSGKIMLLCFLDCEDIIMTDYWKMDKPLKETTTWKF